MTLLMERKPPAAAGAAPLRPEFRRGFAPLAGAAVLLTLVVALAVPAESWQGGWAETRDRTHTAAVLLGIPLALAAGCWQGGRERRRGTGDLLETAVRGALPRFLASAVPVALWVAVGHLVAAGCALLATWYCATGDSPYLVVPLTDSLLVGMAALAGQVVGRAVPWRLAAPVLATAGYAVLGFLSYDHGNALSGLSPLIDTSDHRMPVWWQPWVSVVWVGGLAAAAVLALTARRPVTALVPLACATAAAVALVQAGGLTRPNPVAQRQVCDTSTTPQVCVNTRYEKLLPQITEALSGLTGRLEGVDNVPVRFEDRVGRSRADEAELPMVTPLGWSVVRGKLTEPERYAWEAGMALVGREECDHTDPVVARADAAVEHYLAPSPTEKLFDDLDARGSATDRAELKARQQARARLLGMAEDERRAWLSEYFATAKNCDRNGVPTL
ncbi:hypothetical protein [Streptomyces sp. NPDC056628]|uniref:hypothetical protein n=1 Tax=Streptomyces sp. NPDC056628 TaxID=3345882 RepID=UPI0036910AA9